MLIHQNFLRKETVKLENGNLETNPVDLSKHVVKNEVVEKTVYDE